MLDSWNMSFLHRGRGNRDSIFDSVFAWPNSCVPTIGGLLFSCLMCSLTASLYAQEPAPSGYPDGTRNSNGLDCSDPLLSASAECSSQSSEQNGSLLGSGMRTVPSGTYGTQTGNRNSNYSDIESLTRQPSNMNQAQPVLPPEPLTEFQKFAASTTGQILPIFGMNLFRRVPSTFAPLDMAPVPSDYVVGPGDELRLRAWGQLNFQANVRVDRSGDVYLPQVGPVHVAGLPFSELDPHLREAIGRVFHNFDLTVDVGQIRAIQVYVAGEARRPGVYTVSSLSTLVDALFTSGGPSIQGSLRHIELRRGSEVVTDFDLYGLLVHGDKSKDVKLLSGDVIFIPSAGPQVAITGSVRNPAIYEMRANESLADVIADAGGVSAVAAKARVSIERIDEHRDRLAMEVAYDATGLATSLADGDLVRVYSIVPQYQKTVTLRGNIANPGRFAWHPGMRISELIPDKDSLITRNYWWKRTQLGLPAPEFEPVAGFADQRQPAENHPITMRIPSPESSSTANQPGSQQENQSGAPQDNQLGTEQEYQSQTQQDQYGAPQNQRLNAQQRLGNTSLAAEQGSTSTRAPRAVQRTEIRLLAPEIDWDYAVIERLDKDTLKTILLPFDLGKLVLHHDTSQDLELEPGDVVSIFSEGDIRVPIAEQTKLVRLDGEFVHAGEYTVRPGETLRQLVERAGGITPNAYLYGSEFTRESTRAVQQSRIDEYVQSLGLRIQRSNLALAASATGSPQDLASGASAQNTERDLLASLRQVRATGRIVLQFKPDSHGLDMIPEISLEDGDRFIVPHVPEMVNVVGAVYDQNSFLFAQDRRVATYLRMAGGPNRDADRGHEFIIRADGEVVSNETSKGLWGSEFHTLRVNPGDTIVVPEKTFKPSALRGFLDWSQMFSQFALGAAAISVIK
jgi:protein involved in polysaccharide export with SLBB domain